MILHTVLYFIKSGEKHSGVDSYNFLCIREFRVEIVLHQLLSNSISLNWYLRQSSRVNRRIHIYLKKISPKLKASGKAGICTRHLRAVSSAYKMRAIFLKPFLKKHVRFIYGKIP